MAAAKKDTAAKPAKETKTTKDAKASAKPDKAAEPEKPAKEPKAPREKNERKNGVVRPKAGTKTGSVWETADKITAKNKTTATRAEVLGVCSEANGYNQAMAATQYGRWRRFNGITGRLNAE